MKSEMKFKYTVLEDVISECTYCGDSIAKGDSCMMLDDYDSEDEYYFCSEKCAEAFRSDDDFFV